MSYETLGFEIEEGVAWITLQRPRAANAMNAAMMTELRDVAIRCDEEPEIRVTVLTGSGKAFCAGGDLSSFSGYGEALPSRLKHMTADLHAAISRFARMDVPLVTAVNGVAAGAGFSLACAADLCVAAESACFTMAYTRAGLTPDGSSTFFVLRLAGLRRTQELMLTNRMLSATEALDWNLVNRVVPDASLEEEVRELALSLAKGPTRALGQVKRLLLHSSGDHLEAQMELEARAIADAARSADGREGIAAFLEKRPPVFRGA